MSTERAGQRGGGISAALARAAAYLIAQSAARGVHLSWLERRLTAAWAPGADGAPEGLFLAHTDQHSDRAGRSHHSDVAGKHVDVPSEVGHADFQRPHMDSHTDIPHHDVHTDKFSDTFGDVIARRSVKLPPKRKKSPKKA